MIKESGRVVAVDDSYVWLETINRGTCGTCVAEKGCGQSLLARWMSHNQYLKVSLDGRSASDFAINDEICIGIPENVVVVSSLLIYCLPLLGLMLGAALGQAYSGSDVGAIVCAVVGLLLGAALVRGYSWIQRNNRQLRPVILDMLARHA
jgi:sigma-E factor negative regulatory protein RseC